VGESKNAGSKQFDTFCVTLYVVDVPDLGKFWENT
jgi:hypothetical protein